MLKEFKEFIARGNVLDLAVAFIMGTAFGKIVTSFVNDILMPPIGLLLNGIDFTNMFVSLTGTHYDTLAKAQEAGAATINYGLFINTIIDFVIVSFALFLIIRQVNRMQRKPEPPPPAEPTTKECPYCLSTISIKAVRCPHCTSELKA